MSRWPETWNCDEITQHLELFLDGELPAGATTRFRSHLDRCRECAARVHLANEIQNELHALPELDTPAPVLQQILDQTVRTRESRPSLATLWGRWPRPAWAALAAAALALAFGLGVFNQRFTSSEPAPPDTAALAQATAEARYALAKTGLLTRRAGRALRDKTLRDQIVAPTSRGLARAFGGDAAGQTEVSSEGVSDV